MNEPLECLEITKRFFEALDTLKDLKHIRGLGTFADRYDLNYWNFYTARKDSQRIKQEWLTYLVRDYNVSATWLLTGKGRMFTRNMPPMPKFRNKGREQKASND